MGLLMRMTAGGPLNRRPPGYDQDPGKPAQTDDASPTHF